MLKKYGYFSKDGKEFIITRPDTPTPWLNYISNGDYCGVVSNTGGGVSFYKCALTNRLTHWRPEGLPNDRPGRYIYIRDDKDGDYWSLTWQPVMKNPTFYECHHGPGYTRIISECKKIYGEVLYFVPQELDSIEIWQVKLKNLSKKHRKLTVFNYVEFCVGNALEDITSKNEQHFNFAFYEDNTVYAYKSWEDEPEYGFLFTTLKVHSYDCDRETFIGSYYRSEANPLTVEKGKCTNSALFSGVMVGALCSKITLKPNETISFVTLLGIGKNKQDVKRMIKKYSNLKTVETEFTKLNEIWDQNLERCKINTPNKNMNIMVNVWNRVQVKALFDLSRAASMYQWGLVEGVGYRDTCQDNIGYLLAEPEKTKDKIKLLAEFQFSDGSAYHTFFRVTKQGIKTNHSDDHLWLVLAVLYYVIETGDLKFFDEEVKFADNKIGTIYEHCIKAINYTLSRTGPHGLPLIGEADWNDCLNCGRGGKGESVWLAQFLHYIFTLFVPIAKLLGKNTDVEKFSMEAEKIKKLVNDTCWDGKWYIRAYTDDGTVIGSSKSPEGKIYLNTQSWAVISGIASKERGEICMNSVREILDTKWGPRIVYPPYTKWDDRIGYVTRCVIGKKENGAVFSHPITWAIIAECLLGRAEIAYDYYTKTLPMNPNRDFDKFKTEPYAYPEFVYAPEHKDFGRGGHSWMTGSGPWFLRAAIDYILGVRPTINGLLIDPCIPSKWKEYQIRRKFRNAVYEIHVSNPRYVSKGVKSILVDGKKVEGNILPVFDDNKIHKVEVELGR